MEHSEHNQHGDHHEGSHNRGDHHCGVLLLAAGFSRRFGGVKLKALLPDGLTIFQKTLKNILLVTDNVIVVGRKELKEDGVYDSLPASGKQTLVLCEDAEAGMGQSLAFGIQQVPEHWQSVLICLADMPLVQASTLRELIQGSGPDRILIPVFDQQRGQPVSFGRDFFNELAQSHGDNGGRHIIRDHGHRVLEWPTRDRGILIDIDTPETLAALTRTTA